MNPVLIKGEPFCMSGSLIGIVGREEWGRECVLLSSLNPELCATIWSRVGIWIGMGTVALVEALHLIRI